MSVHDDEVEEHRWLKLCTLNWFRLTEFTEDKGDGMKEQRERCERQNCCRNLESDHQVAM